jgi:hypothetical protein
MNVGEYNTLDLIKDNTKEKPCVFFVPLSLKCKRKTITYYSKPGCNLDFGQWIAAVYV